jgi:hypothetical protein
MDNSELSDSDSDIENKNSFSFEFESFGDLCLFEAREIIVYAMF